MAGNRELKAHQTTIRFSDAQWEQLERAARRRDVSVAQYVRDAARVRLEADASRHTRADAFEAGIEHAREAALNEAESTAALWEQGRQARARAQMLREESQRHRHVLGERAEDRLDQPPPSGEDWTKGRGPREREQMKRDEAGRVGDRLR